MRHETLISVTLRVVEAGSGSEGPAVVSSMSRGGIFVAAPTQAAIGQTVQFAFTVAEGQCLAVGNIIQNRGEAGFAVEFQGETAEMKAFFDRMESLPGDQQWSLLQSISDGIVEIV